MSDPGAPTPGMAQRSGAPRRTPSPGDAARRDPTQSKGIKNCGCDAEVERLRGELAEAQTDLTGLQHAHGEVSGTLRDVSNDLARLRTLLDEGAGHIEGLGRHASAFMSHWARKVREVL